MEDVNLVILAVFHMIFRVIQINLSIQYISQGIQDLFQAQCQAQCQAQDLIHIHLNLNSAIIFKKVCAITQTASNEKKIFARYFHGFPDYIARQTILTIPEDKEISALTKVGATMFAAGTKSGLLTVWDMNFKEINKQNIGYSCTALSYLELQTEMGVLTFLVCGISGLDPTSQQNVFGIKLIGSGDFYCSLLSKPPNLNNFVGSPRRSN